MIEQHIGTVPTLPTAPSLDRINEFDADGVAFADALKPFGDALNQRAEELNTSFEEVNATHEAINTIKSDTQGIKESAISETTQIKESAITALNGIKNDAESARDEAILARDEAVGAVASLPDGVINNNTVSETDTWSSQKISQEISGNTFNLAQIQAIALSF